MSQNETIQTPQDYVNYTFNIEARGVAELSSDLMGLSNTVSNILGQLAFKTSEFLSHTESIAISAGLAISSMFVSATKDAINFQQQVANVQAIGGETINASAIGNAAMEYSNKFGMATSSMTEGLEALARAGITSTEVMKEVLAEGVKLSKLEGMDLEDSINDLISTTNLLSEGGIDMNNPNYGKFVQEMNQHIVSTSESAPINAQNIIQSLQHVGGYASASGMDQEDLFAVIAQLGARGTKGEMAGTALRAFIAAGQKDTAQRALKRVGLNVSDLWNDNGETMLSISEMKNVLDEALESRGYSKQEKLEFYSDFVGYKQANQIMKIDTSEVEKYKKSINEAWDLGKKLETILGTVRGNLDRIWQITQNFMTKVGGQLLTIAGIFLEPIRAMLEFVTALPGADTVVAVSMIFIAFRTGLLIFNKLVPALSGFMSGLNHITNRTAGFREEWQKTGEEIQKAKDIIDLIRHGDQEGLAIKHYQEHGLSAKNKAIAEDVIAGQMYMGSSWYQEHGRIPWKDLDAPVKDMITERWKGTSIFKQNYDAYVQRTRKAVDEITSNPIIVEEFENKGTLEAINSYVQEIFHLLNGDRTQGKTDNTNDENSTTDNRRRNAQSQILSSIFENRVRGNTYGNVNFKYERNEEGYAEAKAGLKQAYKDLRDYTRALSNTNIDDINTIQKNAYKKLFTQVSERGIEATKTANESEIRLVLEKGVLETHENPWEGIKDSQVRYISEKLGLDDFKFYDSAQGDRRAEFAQQARAAIERQDEEVRQGIIDELVRGSDGNGGTNKIWEDSLQDIARGRRELLVHNPEIANKIISQISNINTQGYETKTDAVLAYFNGLDESHEDWNIAIKSAMEVLKGDSQYSKIEENTIKYIADNIARYKETMLSYQADAETLGFSENIKNEIEDVINDMRNDEAVLRQGGSLLGEAIVNGFVGDGLGRHSPGRMFWALVDEQTDINKAILQSKGLLNKNAGLLGLEMTNAFDKNLGINRVFDSGIEFLRRDSDVIKDIIENFDKDEFRTDDEQDLEYDLLPRQQDVQDYLNPANKTALEHFVRPYGFDMSNYERFGTNFGRDWNDIARFQSMMWFLKNDFDSEKMSDSSEFDDNAIYDYMNLMNKHFNINSTWLQLKTYPGDIDSTLYANMNTWLEDFYFIFLDTLSMNMHEIITNSKGLADNVKLYRGGRLPLTGENLGEYLGTTSTSYAQRIGDYYAALNEAVNYKTNIFAPEGTLGIYPNPDLLRDKTFADGVKSKNVYNNQLEYTLGSGQPFIELPNEVTGKMSAAALKNEPDILLLNPTQIAAVTNVVADEVSSMINSGRTNSNILNKNGIQAVNDVMTEDNIISTDSLSDKRFYGVYDYHAGDRGLIYDAVQYLRYTTRKRVVSPDDLYSLIASVNNETAAASAMEWLNNTYMQDVINQKGNIQLKPLATMIEKNDNFDTDFTKGRVYASVSPEQIFRIVNKFPETAQELLSILQPFTSIDKTPTLKDFKNRKDFNQTFLKIPYEYTWLLGQAEASGLESDNYDTIYDAEEHYPTPTIKDAKRIIKNLGIDAFFMPPQTYKDANMRPSVENSYDRMIMGLAYGYLSDKPGVGGSHNAYNGIKAGRMGTEFYGPLQTLETIIHEFTHMGLDQFSRRDLDESDPLYLPDKKIAQIGVPGLEDKTGYDDNYHAIMSEFETNWVTTQVLAHFGLTEMADKGLIEQDKALNRVGHFYDAVLSVDPNNEKYFQWEIYDEWIKTISKNIDMFIDIGEEFDKKYSLLSPEEISQKWEEVRTLVNNAKAQSEFGMPGLVENSSVNYHAIMKRQEEIANLRKQMADDEKRWAEEGIEYAQKKREYLKKLREEQVKKIRIQEQLENDTNYLQYLTNLQNRGGIVSNTSDSFNKHEDISDEEYKMRIDQEMATKYPHLFPDLDNKFNQARYSASQDENRNENVIKIINFGESIHNKVHDTALRGVSKIANGYNEEETQGHIRRINTTQNTISNISASLESFNGGLSRAAEVLPVLSPLVWGLDTALWALNTVSTILEITETLLNTSKMQDILVSLGLFTAEEAETVAKALATTTTWGLTGAILGLEAAIAGPLLAIILVVIAVIAAIYMSEKKHAEALKEQQQAIEDSTKSVKSALAGYKSLYKARLAATSAGRKYINSIKEEIALRKLQIAGNDRLDAIRKKNKANRDPIWGETDSLRTKIQTNKNSGIIPMFLAGPAVGIAAKALAGEYKPIADQHSENIYQTTQIVDVAQTSSNGLSELDIGGAIMNAWEKYDNSYAKSVSDYYSAHSQQFAEMDTFAPELEKLYEVETQAIRLYGDDARNSPMFMRAMQEVADETRLNGKTLGQYLDYMQAEANVEHARTLATSKFDKIKADAQARAMKIMYPDSNQMGDLDSLQDTMVKAMIEDEARKTKRELFEQSMMEITQGIYSLLNLDFETADKHFEMAGTYYNTMQEVDQKKEGILQESLEIARANERKDYGTGPYSIYGDTPFGGAIESARSVGMPIPNYSGTSSRTPALTSSKTSANINQASQNTRASAEIMKELMNQNRQTLPKQNEKNLGQTLLDAIWNVFDFVNPFSPSPEEVQPSVPSSPQQNNNTQQPVVNKYEIKVEQININTEDDPEKIKSALMNLIIEMQERITPRQVSRTIGELANNNTNENTVEGIDSTQQQLQQQLQQQQNNINRG